MSMQGGRSSSLWLLLVSVMIATTAAAQPAPPAPPQVFLNTTYPTEGPAVNVTACANLQLAIDNAHPGDTIRITAGLTCTGSFVLRKKSNPNQQWIIIRSASPMFDATGAVPPGTRVDGNDASQTPQMVKLRSSGLNAPVIKTEQSGGGLIAGYYRLVGLDIAIDPINGDLTNFVLIGSATETNAANQPSFIYIDRCYIHGNDAGQFVRGVALMGSSLAVIDSWISNIHATADSQTINGWNGPGPFKIFNNYLEASGENIMFGGGDPAINQLISSDIEVRRNYMTKRLAWRGVPDATVKNIFELKNAQRVLLDGNLLEYSWVDGQDGFAILLTTRNQGGSCTWCVVRDITVTNNHVRHAAVAVQILGFDYTNPSGQTQRILIRNNLFEDINQVTWANTGYAGKTIQIWDGPSDLNIDHNTILQYDTNVIRFGSATNDTVVNFAFTKNLVEKRTSKLGVAGEGNVSEGTTTLSTYAPGYIFSANGFGNVTASSYPSGNQNQYPTQAIWESQFMSFNGGNGGNYHLVQNNIYAQAGNGDVGADIDTINCAIDPNQCNGFLLTDNFDDNSIDTGKWSPNALFTGVVDSTIPVAETNQRIEIGDLKQNDSGSAYNGMRSLAGRVFPFTSAYAEAQLVQIADPAATGAYAMFAVGVNSDNFYRWYVNAGALVVEQKILGIKTNLASFTYDATNHQFLRIRHCAAVGPNCATAGTVVFETAPAAGTPSTARHSQAWDTTNVPLDSIAFEMKAGTTGLQPVPPGKVAFDNFTAKIFE